MCIRDSIEDQELNAADGFKQSAISAVAASQGERLEQARNCLLYTSDAADERSSVDLGGRRIIKKKNTKITFDELRISNNIQVQLQESKTDLIRPRTWWESYTKR